MTSSDESAARSQLIERVKGLVPARGPALSRGERDLVLEIAYLAIAADRRLHDDEIEAFSGVASRLADLLPPGESVDEDLDELLNRFAQSLDREHVDARLREVAAKLPRPDLRELTYRVAYGLSLADLDTSDEEFQFDLELIDALELSNAVAERIAHEVGEALRAS